MGQSPTLSSKWLVVSIGNISAVDANRRSLGSVYVGSAGFCWSKWVPQPAVRSASSVQATDALRHQIVLCLTS